MRVLGARDGRVRSDGRAVPLRVASLVRVLQGVHAVIVRAFWYLVCLLVRAYAFTRPSVTIHFPTGPYMRRWFLTCTPEDGSSGPPGYYLHEWFAPDADRRLHNHPWEDSSTRILEGGYLEVRSDWGLPPRLRVRRVGDRAVMNAATRHRVASLAWPGPTRTLFHAGPKHGKGWGPKGEGGWLEWHEPGIVAWMRRVLS